MTKSAQKKRDFHERQNDISPIPKVKNKRRRAKCEKSLLAFLRTYLPHLFYRPASKDMKDVVKGLEKAIKRGGKKSRALPRGFGKTTIGIGAVLWAVLYGYRHFVVIIGPNEEHAENITTDIKTELDSNELLLADFPETCFPLAALEGRFARTKSQACKGKLTKIDWRKQQITLATIAKSKTSGTIIRACGITSAIRGMKRGARRPDFVFLDDPQTRESASSDKQTSDREETILGDILGLAGHDKAIACYMTCTVIVKKDLADRFLDRELHPDWDGKRGMLVYAWSKSKFWKEYDEIWKTDQQKGDGEFKGATKFYRKHRRSMDKGAEIADKYLFDKASEVSAVQHAHNLKLVHGSAAFCAEFQNAPLAREFTLYDLTPDIVMSRCNGLTKRKADPDAKLIVAFTDINFSGLHWAITAFRNDRTAFVIDYGRLPERGVLVKANANETETNQLIAAALMKWVEKINGLNLPLNPRAVGIDRGYKPDVVAQVVRYSPARFALLPCRGFSGNYYNPNTKELVGKPRNNCHMSGGRFGQFLAANSCYFREVVQRGFLSRPGTPGSVSLWGKDRANHKDIANHICAEVLTDKAEGRKGVMWKWSGKPGAPNDWLDAVVGCFALASWFMGDPVLSDNQPQQVHRRKKTKAKRRQAKIQIED